MDTRTAFNILWTKTGDRNAALDYLTREHELKTTHDIIHLSDPEPLGLAFFDQLTRVGVAVVKVIDSEQDLQDIQRDFKQTLQTFPEYLDTANVHVAGGFSALGNPGSFHNPLVRKLRQKAHDKLKPLIKPSSNDQKFEVLFDRMMFRRKGMAPVAEAWHRDVMDPKKIHADDEIFGGWINLDSDSQFFSAIPGSHLNIKQSEIQHGFDTLEKHLARNIDKNTANREKLIKQEIKQIGSQLGHRFEVPPLHMIVFPQYILHEVVANKAKHDMMRLFTGWRITVSDTPLHVENKFNENIIDTQAVPPLPGSMMPPMYSMNHLSYFVAKPFQLIPNNYSDNLVNWSNSTFKNICLSPPKRYTEKQQKLAKGQTYSIVNRHMRSLDYYNFQKYKDYTPEEREIYKPNDF